MLGAPWSDEITCFSEGARSGRGEELEKPERNAEEQATQHNAPHVSIAGECCLLFWSYRHCQATPPGENKQTTSQ